MAVCFSGGYVSSCNVPAPPQISPPRPFLFSSSHPPATVASCIAAIDVLEGEPGLIDRLWVNTKHFKEGMRALGFDIGISETPITPVMCGEAPVAMRLSDELMKRGVFAQGIGFPTVPKGRARVRTIVTAAHSPQELDLALEVFAGAGRAVGLI